MLETAAVLLVLELIGLAALPLSLRALRRLPLAGVAFAKPLGLLLLAYLAWLLGALGVPNGPGLAIAAAVVLALAGLAARSGAPLEAPRRHVIVCEALFVGAFLACALFTAFSPDVWNTEKPMDMMLVNATLTSPGHPPHDPWLAGTDVNYYYLGHLASGLLIRLTGVEPTVGYNLALAAIFAFAAVGAYGLAAAIVRASGRGAPEIAGAVAVVLLLVAGSVGGGLDALQHDGPLERFQWFEPSRVIDDTINEFPFFSFLLGDLHAHVIALPFTLLALAFIAAVVLRGPPRMLRWETALATLVIALLYTVNSWSWPSAAGLYLIALALHGPRAALKRWLGMVALGVVLILPFLIEFEPNARGIGIVDERERLEPFARHHLAIYGALMWACGAAYLGRLKVVAHPFRLTVWGMAAIIFAVFLLEEATLAGAAILLAFLAVAVHALVTTPAERIVWLLIAGGLICLIVPEIVHVRDEFEGSDLYRMNTVFKMGYQAWIMLAIAGACAVAWTREWLGRVGQVAWLGGLAMLVGLGLVFTVAGSYARKDGFANSPTLDGRRWLATTAPGDIAAIDWLRENADGDDVILEAVGDDYSPFGHARISTYTGLQTVVGWEGHELQFRKDAGGRRADVRSIYTGTQVEPVRALLRRYRVRYAVVGPLERTDYGDSLVLTGLGRRVFQQGGTAIYELPVPDPSDGDGDGPSPFEAP